MKPLSDDEFKAFLKDYKRHYIPSAEISKPLKKDEFGNITGKGKEKVHSKFPMCSLDDMKDECKEWNNFNKPKSTDGIFYKDFNGNLVIYLVEFKGHNLNENNEIIALRNHIQEKIEENEENDTEKICYTHEMVKKLEKIGEEYRGPVQHSLEQKPVETLLITIPTIYKDYCKRKGIPEKDIMKFLRTHEKRFFVFAHDKVNKDENEENEERERDDDATKKYIVPLKNKLNGYYLKLKRGKIIDFFYIYDFDKFDWWLKKEKLKRPPRRILNIDIHKFDDEMFN